MSEQIPYRRTFIRLLGFLRPYRWSLLVSTILAVLSQAAAIAIVLLVGEAIEGIEAGRGTTVLAWLVVAISVVGIIKAALMLGRRIISGRQALGIEKDMREGLYAHLLRLSFGFYDRHQTGQLMSRATVDLQSVRFFLGFGLIFFFQHALTVVSVMVVLFVVEWQLALIALAITPVIVAVAYRYSHVSHPVLREVQQKLGDVATVTEESIVGVHVVKAFAQEERRQAQFERASGAVFEQTVRAFRQRALYVPLLSFLPLLAQGAVLLAAGRMVVNGSLGLSAFFVFNLLLAMLIVPLRSLGMWIGQAQRATASGERIFEVMDEPEGVDDRPGAGELPPGPGEIRFERVTFGYATGRPVLEEIDLVLAPGQDGGADRPHRLGQDDPRRARAALLRRDRRAACSSTASTSATSPAARSAGRSESSPRIRSSSPRASARTSPSACSTRPRSRSSAPPAPRRRTSSCSSCRRATTPSSASAGSRSRAGSGSGSRSPARS